MDEGERYQTGTSNETMANLRAGKELAVEVVSRGIHSLRSRKSQRECPDLEKLLGLLYDPRKNPLMLWTYRQSHSDTLARQCQLIIYY